MGTLFAGGDGEVGLFGLWIISGFLVHSLSDLGLAKKPQARNVK